MSKSLVARYKNELRTTGDLIELIDILKRVALSQFQSLDSTRQRRAWTRSETPSESNTLIDERSSEESGGTTARPDAKGPALSLGIVLENFFRLIPRELCRHPFVESPAPPLGLLIVTTDEGFLGGLNSAVIQKALSVRGEQPAEITVLGERGKTYFRDQGLPFTHFPGVGEHIVPQRVEALRDHIAAQFLRRKVGRMVVVYPRPLSFTLQQAEAFQLLPYERPSGSPGVSSAPTRETILEPSAFAIIEYLVKLWLTRKLHEVFWQSRLAELGARAMHLEASLQELAQQRKKQTLKYFRSMHEVTDTSIRETYAGVVARRKDARERQR